MDRVTERRTRGGLCGIFPLDPTVVFFSPRGEGLPDLCCRDDGTRTQPSAATGARGACGGSGSCQKPHASPWAGRTGEGAPGLVRLVTASPRVVHPGGGRHGASAYLPHAGCTRAPSLGRFRRCSVCLTVDRREGRLRASESYSTPCPCHVTFGRGSPTRGTVGTRLPLRHWIGWDDS
ncbi:hypothetical protein ISCGN_001658 [Ixodes scapularis]